MAIEFYKEFGDLGYLANYSNHSFVKNGILYKTVEHYYQSEKFLDEKIKNKIIEAPTPKEASLIGRDRSNIRRPNFKMIKNDVMYEGILEKFRQNREIAYKLIETRSQMIAEATKDEYYWGIGTKRNGQNEIGKILVKVREKIKEEILESILSKAECCSEVYVIGHKRPDADSMFSSYILANILKSQGINAKMAILDNEYQYASESKLLIDDYLPCIPVTVSKDNKFILVDHNNLEGLDKDNVIGAIDHHMITNEVYDTLEVESSSTALFIYELFKDKYEFSHEEKILIYLSVLADTDYLCSTGRYKEEDKELVESLNIKLDIDDLQKKYFVINNFLLDIDSNLYSNYKEYNRNQLIIKRSLIYSYSEQYKEYYNIYKDYIDKKNDNLLLIWCDFEDKKTYVYYDRKSYIYNYIITSTNVILKEIGI